MTAKETASMVALAARVGAHVLRERIGPTVKLPDRHTVPPSAESITTSWLTDALCRQTPGAEVVSVEVTGGDNGTSARRAMRVAYNASGTDAGLPTSLFTKSSATLASRLLLGLTEIAEGEAAFYTTIRPTLEIRSPRAYYAGFDPRTHRSIVLLEDLSTRGWTFPDPMANPVTRSDAEDMVREMATYHSALWESPRFAGDLASLKQAEAWQVNLNRKAGFERRTLRGLERAAAVVPPELTAQRDDLYPAFMRSLALHASSPRTLLHQDLHLGNWLRDQDGRMGLYDWQCVATGHWALDYSYALAGGLATDDRREWEEDLLRLYLEALVDGGVKSAPTFDEAWQAYRQQPMHALAFGLFTLGGSRFEPELQPKDYTLAAIARISQHVVDLGSIRSLL